MLKRIAILAGILLATMAEAGAMDFTWRDQFTVQASGPIGMGDAAKFAALQRFEILELDSPGGIVDEALRMAANMDARGGIRTVVKSGSSCASACAMVLFVSGKTRVVHMGGRVGIHSCAKDRTPAPECNKEMAANATAHGVPWGVIETFANATKPSDMMWLGAEDAECWGLMKWSAEDTFNEECYIQFMFEMEKKKPAEVTAINANDVLCRMNAGTSRIYVSGGGEGQGFSDAYRTACERIAADPRTPKYAAIDIIMWLTLTDPDVLRLKPATLALHILGDDVENCWKCLTILGMSELMRGYTKEGLEALKHAVELVRRDTGMVPTWLTSRVDLASAELAKNNY
jgi:hypothetical protein